MSGDVVNLRQARKTRRRADHAAEGAANRAKHGRPRHERAAADKTAELAARRLEGHRLDAHRDGDGDAG